MKKNKIIYWTCTALFAGFMLFSAIPDVFNSEEAVKFITHLGYPAYFVPFIGIAKILGSVAIVIPQLKRIKEWAYAGLFFDLIGAVYSILMIEGFQPGLLMMLPILAVGITSYVYKDKLALT
ncbi:MAG TPA: DoxX family protein [Bacteroidia bacterium]|nr:DoxX family protein [Bacteroidia bacterium]HRH08434.1 DoxX family protein [Bacteroidia bacterium]HRH64165.1 DoxX family protein [Bacteroidia bacterium]